MRYLRLRKKKRRRYYRHIHKAVIIPVEINKINKKVTVIVQQQKNMLIGIFILFMATIP